MATASIIFLVLGCLSGFSCLLTLIGYFLGSSNYLFFLSKLSACLFLFLIAAICYCGSYLKKLYEAFQKSANEASPIPKSEAKKDFKYLYVYTNDIGDEDVKKQITKVFENERYVPIESIESLNPEERKKVISANIKVKKSDSIGIYAAHLFGKNIDGQTVFSIRAKGSSVDNAVWSAIEAIKQ